MVTPYFSNIRQAIITSLSEATNEILLAVYWFTNHQLFSILCSKAREGKKVSVIIHNDYINNRETGLPFQDLIDAGGHFFFSDSNNPMHNKFCVIDGKVLINGSYNWTYYAEDRNSENILIISDENHVIDAYRKEFFELASALPNIDKIEHLSSYELDEFDTLSSREYLVNDIIYQAKATNNPEIVEAAFKLSPDNIKIQETAGRLQLIKRKKLNYSIGVGVKDNKYLIGVERGTVLPVTVSNILITIEDNQLSCVATLYYGEKDIASLNKQMPNYSNNGHKGGVAIKGLPPQPKGQARMKIVFTIDIYGLLKVKFYSLDNGKYDTYQVNINNLLEQIEAC